MQHAEDEITSLKRWSNEGNISRTFHDVRFARNDVFVWRGWLFFSQHCLKHDFLNQMKSISSQRVTTKWTCSLVLGSHATHNARLLSQHMKILVSNECNISCNSVVHYLPENISSPQGWDSPLPQNIVPLKFHQNVVCVCFIMSNLINREE